MKFLRKRQTLEIEELDITSLLDVLVILLVFLLQNMANSELSLDLVNDLSLPFSESRGTSESGVIVQVNSAKEIFLHNEVIASLEDEGEYQNKLIDALNKETKRLSGSTIDKKVENGQIINLLLDETLDYKTIDKLLKSVAKAGYTQFKFIVQGVE
jgi:biopolymer transport protein ExbD